MDFEYVVFVLVVVWFYFYWKEFLSFCFFDVVLVDVFIEVFDDVGNDDVEFVEENFLYFFLFVEGVFFFSYFKVVGVIWFFEGCYVFFYESFDGFNCFGWVCDKGVEFVECVVGEWFFEVEGEYFDVFVVYFVGGFFDEFCEFFVYVEDGYFFWEIVEY